MNKELHWYEYIFRGFSLGCQPKGFVDRDEGFGRFGAVAYDRPLTDKEVEEYELKPIKEI